MIGPKLLIEIKIKLEALILAQVQLAVHDILADNPNLISTVHIRDAKLMIFNGVLERMRFIESNMPAERANYLKQHPQLNRIFHPDYISAILDEVLADTFLELQGGEWVEPKEADNHNDLENGPV